MKLRSGLRHFLRRSGDALYRGAAWVYEPPPSPPLASPDEIRNASWNAIRGDETLRLDYDLHDGSMVFDLGGYRGQWACDIFAKYGCFLHIFEPVRQFAGSIERRFAKNRRVSVHPFGLAAADGTMDIAVTESDWSSLHRLDASGAHLEQCKLVRASDFWKTGGFRVVDLMKINIEGAEYDLLDHLMEHELVSSITNIQVQFHEFVPNAQQRMARIQEALSRTHRLTYQYPFIWENWRRKT